MSYFIEQNEPSNSFFQGGLFLDANTVPTSFITLIPSSSSSNSTTVSCFSWGIKKWVGSEILRVEVGGGGGGGVFSSLSLSLNGSDSDHSHRYTRESNEVSEQQKKKMEEGVCEEKENVRVDGSGAVNMTKHLWAGAFAAMVSRTFVAPLERLKLEYIVRGEQKNLFELIQTISASQGLKGFWKGNFVNILRTAPFKAINFYAYDTYKSKLVRMLGNEESTNFERFVAGAAAGITATLLCLPMDTIRTVMVAPGNEALGGVIGVFRHMIKTEGFFSLYKGLVPSIISMAPSGAVYYGVYDILKSAYLHSPEGMKRLRYMKEEGQELNALEQLELGTIRTLLYGAIAGCCSEAATYPFEVVRRQLQLQVPATRLNALATCVKIVEQGGVPALYAGLTPSLLQVLPSAAISYFVYEFMKIVLKVEST
ncbi:Mitochondrial substrate carrier family protein [Trifolium repens]|nr:Mitochondrial substrate carrier family protein [Trifolium repens]